MAGRCEVGAERFFDDHAPLAAVFIGQARAAQLFDGRLVKLRRGGQVINARAVFGFFDFVQQLGESREVFGTADVAGVIVDVLREAVPKRGVEIVADESSDGLWPDRCATRRA